MFDLIISQNEKIEIQEKKIREASILLDQMSRLMQECEELHGKPSGLETFTKTPSQAPKARARSHPLAHPWMLIR